jgi:hypothetical protein
LLLEEYRTAMVWNRRELAIEPAISRAHDVI